jgi:hypothetical protein
MRTRAQLAPERIMRALQDLSWTEARATLLEIGRLLDLAGLMRSGTVADGMRLRD